MASKITNKLLKDAIADAEAVRETAMANAKLYLEEAMTPGIQAMISRRIQAEAGGDSYKEAKETPFEDADAEGSSDMPANSSTIGSGENKEPSDDAFDASGIGDGGENVDDSHTDWYDDWNESDFDLNEVIAELEEDIAALEDRTAPPSTMGNNEEDDGEDEEEDAGEDEEEDDGKDKEDQNPNMERTLTRKDLEEILAELMNDEGEVEGDEVEGDEVKGDEGDEVDLEEILAELDAADEADEDDAAGQIPASVHNRTTEIARLQKENREYNTVVKILKHRLNEVNLLNAKLLFTNKLFRKEGLNTDQKVRIVESFDRATNVREVKLVYAALVENLSVAAKTFSTSRKKIVAEGLASKPTRSTAPKPKEVIVENTVARRLQELAGIIS